MDEVVLNDQVESQDSATNPDEDITTWKKRLAGKDQALTTTKKQYDELKSEFDKVQAWKLQMEEASLSEFERAQRKIQTLEEQLKATRESEQRERLSKEYPTYVKWQQESAQLTDEDRAKAFEELVKAGGGNSAQAFVDPNRPAREQEAKSKRTIDDITSEMARLGNPFQD
jgi:DNA repair exonuclease SbcCD ATPase subunit